MKNFCEHGVPVNSRCYICDSSPQEEKPRYCTHGIPSHTICYECKALDAISATTRANVAEAIKYERQEPRVTGKNVCALMFLLFMIATFVQWIIASYSEGLLQTHTMWGGMVTSLGVIVLLPSILDV